MARKLNEFIIALPEVERARIEARAGELISEEMSLQDLRKAIGKTQIVVAKRLKVGQDAVSKLETRSDMYISTLRGVLKAMGGELELIARFPNRPPVRLEKLGTTATRRKRDRRTAA
jgi:transcriptional regulator with XRE-family HTH domain